MGKKKGKGTGSKKKKGSVSKKKPSKAASEETEERGPRRTKSTKGRNRAVKVVLVLIVVLVIVAVALIGFAPQEYLTVSEITKNKDLYKNKEVDVRGVVMNGTLDLGNKTFFLNDGKARLKIIYDDILPDAFGVEKEVVITGKLKDDGTFHASKIQVGCPSKYEES